MRLFRMETAMVHDVGVGAAGVAFNHGDIIAFDDSTSELEAEAERWLDQGVVSDAEKDAKPKHSYPIKRREPKAKAEKSPKGGKTDGK